MRKRDIRLCRFRPPTSVTVAPITSIIRGVRSEGALKCGRRHEGTLRRQPKPQGIMVRRHAEGFTHRQFPFPRCFTLTRTFLAIARCNQLLDTLVRSAVRVYRVRVFFL